jgi:hypothetical protein
MPVTKNRDAYRRYTTFESTRTSCHQYVHNEKKQERTLVFEEVAHACAASKYELCDVLDNLGLLLGWHRHEPFREAHFTLSREKSFS